MLSNPNLVEYKIKNILSNYLKNKNLERNNRTIIIYNLIILFIIFLIISIILYSRYQNKENKKVKEEEKEKYIYSTLKKYKQIVEEPYTKINLN